MAKHDVEKRIAELAAGQHGVVARAQLLAAGLSGQAVEYRVRAQRLRPIHRGVYVVGPSEAPHAKMMAAILVCGPNAFVSLVTAACAWQMLRDPGASELLHVTVVRRHCRHKPGVRVHRVRALGDDEVMEYRGIPITTPARTLLDLASVTSARKLEQALAIAERQQLTDRARLFSLLERYPRRPGAGALRALLDSGDEPAMTQSEAEERFLDLIRRAGLGRPRTNVWVEGYQVDFWWPKQRVVAEVDGFAYHSSSKAFEGDRRRDADFSAAGVHVSRVTWNQMADEPEAVVARFAQVLTRGELRNR